MRFWFCLFCGALSLSAAQAEEPAANKPRTPSFNPDISLILSGSYARLANDPERYALPGFMLGPESGPGTRGLSLAESELVMSANVDDLFYGYFMASIAPDDSVTVEEAAVETRGLAPGVTLRAGRFFSGIGYLNVQHPHVWDFADAPLAYRAFLATRYADDGVQLRWVAPADRFVEFGAEWFRGQNYPAGGAAKNGQGAASVFARSGGDVGDSHAWRGGFSFLRAQALGRPSGAIDTAPDAFSGDSRVAIADFVWKWSPHGNATQTNFKLQAEYLWRREDGQFTADVNAIPGPALSDAYRATQSGWYVQTVYQFMPPWRVGLRYDQLRTQDSAAGANAALFDTLGHTPRRASLMLDWSHSEFSRVRLQISRDRSQPDTDNQVFVQYIMSLGAHGAHSF